MAQTFRPCRIALALVLSLLLVLSVTQLAQAKHSQNPDYPSQDQAQNAVQYYYNIIGPFSEKNVLGQVDSITYGPIYGTGIWERFGACAQYRFTPSGRLPDKATQTARHIFTFQYAPGKIRDNNGWEVVKMDVNAPC